MTQRCYDTWLYEATKVLRLPSVLQKTRFLFPINAKICVKLLLSLMCLGVFMQYFICGLVLKLKFMRVHYTAFSLRIVHPTHWPGVPWRRSCNLFDTVSVKTTARSSIPFNHHFGLNTEHHPWISRWSTATWSILSWLREKFMSIYKLCVWLEFNVMLPGWNSKCASLEMYSKKLF